MRALNSMLKKALVKPFYQANAGFFLVTLGLLFGFLKTPQHLDIAIAMAYHPFYYAIPLVLWLAYALKTLQFCKNTRKQEAYQFLSYLALAPKKSRGLLMLSTQAWLLAPVLGYGTFLAYIAGQEGQWFSLATVSAINLLTLTLAAKRLGTLLTKPVDPNSIEGLPLWTNRLPRSFPMLFIHQLFNRQAVLLLGTKLVSLVLVVGFTMIYDLDGADLRLLSIGLLLSGGVNAIFSFQHQRFQQQHMTLFRNLPISPDRWFWKSLITFLLLSSPEILVLYLNNLSTVPALFLLKNGLLPVALLAFYHAVTYTRSMNMEQFMKYPFFGTAILFFVILGHVEVLWITVALLATSWLLFRGSFRGFELSKEQ